VLALTADGRLTPKERDVFALMLENHSNAAIADALVLSTNTVKSHVRSVLRSSESRTVARCTPRSGPPRPERT
jgi:DNA-binding NarL/FixJ family response regulator